jgi:diguanylate cyclase (GGDEF)-like protein/PAS domain S-box-containing protein
VVARKAAEDALFLEKERAQITLNSIGDAVISTDILGNITYLNQVAEKMTGWSGAAAAGRPFSDVFHIIDGDTREKVHNPMQLAVKQDQTVRLTSHCILIRRDGCESAIEDATAPIHSRKGQVIGAVMVFHDVSEARAMTLKMTHLAQHDLLTDLPNRLLLNDRINQAISFSRRQRKRLAVLFLDLNGFKQINDTLGHAIGDKLLQLVAQRVVTCVRSSDTVSRHGGDEFVVLLPEVGDAGDAGSTAEKILTALAKPYAISERDIHLSGCIGISIYPEDGHDADTLIKNADTAMYQAKGKEPNSYQFFQRPEHRATIPLTEPQRALVRQDSNS